MTERIPIISLFNKDICNSEKLCAYGTITSAKDKGTGPIINEYCMGSSDVLAIIPN